jgi:hypothetical protein
VPPFTFMTLRFPSLGNSHVLMELITKC